VVLQQRTFDLLAFLAAHRDRAVSRDEILASVFGGQLRAAGNVPVQVHNLRRALIQAGGEPGLIQTQGQGYRFTAEAAIARPRPPAEVAAAVPPAPGEPTPGPVQPRRRNRAAVLALAACCVAGAILAFAFLRHEHAGAIWVPPPHSVAVLAFSNMTGDPAQDYLSDGFPGELINTLSRVSPLRVVGRTSSFYFKGKQTTIAEIAHALNVGAVLQGGVWRQGHHVRIEVELSDAATGYQLYADKFDGDEGDLLAFQGEVAVSVSKALQVTLLGNAPSDLTLGGSENAEAFDKYLQGVQLRRNNRMHDATTAFEAAVALDPRFALALSMLAEVAMRRVWVGYAIDDDDPDKLVGLALASADKAAALAPTVGLTHAVRAQMLREASYDLPTAMKEASLARSLSPGDATVQVIYGQVAGSIGQAEDALAAYRHAVDLDPFQQETWKFYGFGLMAVRQYAASIEALRHAGTLASAIIPEAVGAIGLDYVLLGKPREAIQACLDLSPNICLALAYHANKQQPQAQQQLAALMKDHGGNDEQCGFVMIYAQWGRIPDALRIFQHMAHERNSCLNQLGGVKSNPLLDPLRGFPQFQAAVKESEQPL
jgi:TolB-like protein/DNA-binding winged helix-turn-helix (wHTH) protein